MLGLVCGLVFIHNTSLDLPPETAYVKISAGLIGLSTGPIKRKLNAIQSGAFLFCLAAGV
jgi:hypothetical protein